LTFLQLDYARLAVARGHCRGDRPSHRSSCGLYPIAGEMRVTISRRSHIGRAVVPRRPRLARQLVSRQKALAVALLVFLNMAAWVAVVRPIADLLGKVEQRRRDGKRAVRLDRRLAASMVELCDVSPGYGGDAPLADRRQHDVI
jgi:hypothetical protein